jgi:2-polyprenyl-3-methyl-5-hydroxy-6-metoxy-1,4-benzoquinol methylase
MTCAICSGPVELRYRGALQNPDAERFSPTNHTPGEYGDLYACTRCGTVHQPALPEGDELYGLYRRMRDEHYLDEEAGRRRTARRLLDLIEDCAGAPRADGRSGRLLDVGCGPGLLLDEARRRGYEVSGLELSEASATHARETLGLDVQQTPLTAYPPPSEGYDVVVLADVLEHLDDVHAGLDRCRDLLGPGGVLCVVTPDPGSRTAQLAGARWWGYVPAHTYLLPRRTLRRLLTALGLALLADVSLVRTFSLRYWLAGFGERGGPIGALVGAVERAVPESVSLSLSLLDERVMVAQRSPLLLGGPNGAVPAGVEAAAR